MNATAPARTHPNWSSWRMILAASVHNAWLIALPMLIVLSHRNIVGGMALMVLFGTLLQPGLWGAVARFFTPAAFRPGTQTAVLWGLIGFCAYGAVSVIWTPLKSEWEWAMETFLFVLAAAGMLWTMTSLPRHAVQVLAWFLLGAILLATASLGVEAVTGGMIRDLIPPHGRDDKDVVAVARGTAIAICLLPSGMALLWRLCGETGRLPAAAIAAIGAIAVLCLGLGGFAFGVSANVLALAVMLPTAALGWWRPKLTLWLVAGAGAAELILSPFVALMLPPLEEIARMEGAPVSWLQRLVIWRHVADNIFSGPLAFLFGNGINYSQALADARTTITLAGYPVPLPMIPTHPHNVYLQIWLEFGLAGVLIFLGLGWLTIRLVLAEARAMLNPLIAAAWLSMAAAMLVYFTVEASLWTHWRLAAPVWGLYALIAAWRCNFKKNSR